MVYGGAEKIKKSNLKLLLSECGIPLTYTHSPEEFDLLLLIDCQHGQGNVESFDAENESSGKTYDTEEAYDKAFSKYKTESVEKNGEEYFTEIVHYRYGMEKILALVNIVGPKRA
jgi:hypothetical protein